MKDEIELMRDNLCIFVYEKEEGIVKLESDC